VYFLFAYLSICVVEELSYSWLASVLDRNGLSLVFRHLIAKLACVYLAHSVGVALLQVSHAGQRDRDEENGLEGLLKFR